MRHALLLLLLASPALSARIRVGADAKSSETLRRFVTADKAVKARLDDAKAREEAFRAEARESGLRDAVAAAPATREELIAELPGMKVPPAGPCASLAACATIELAEEVGHPELLSDAVRRMLRPWLLLQEARGRKADIETASAHDALLTVRLRGVDTAPLVLNVSPRLLGGFRVWFDEPFRLSAVYERERAAALAAN
jgi:hypothetical protein